MCVACLNVINVCTNQIYLDLIYWKVRHIRTQKAYHSGMCGRSIFIFLSRFTFFCVCAFFQHTKKTQQHLSTFNAQRNVSVSHFCLTSVFLTTISTLFFFLLCNQRDLLSYAQSVLFCFVITDFFVPYLFFCCYCFILEEEWAMMEKEISDGNSMWISISIIIMSWRIHENNSLS